jgi:GMP synthase-like glutamine amidotransferase
MSHGDHGTQAPPGFNVLARIANADIVGFEDPRRGLQAIQFHPEVSAHAGRWAMLRNLTRPAAPAATG